MDKSLNKDGNVLYKLITAITLFVPVPIYMFLAATILNIHPDYILYTTIENVEIVTYVEQEKDKTIETYFLTTKDNATIDGIVEFKDGKYGIYIEEDDIIKIDNNFFSYIIKDEKVGKRELVNIKKYELQKQQGYKIPLSFMISLFGVLMVVLIIQGKMQWYKKHPRIAALIALLSVTVVLFILNTIISNILNVFIIATVSWGLYCLEYTIQQGKIEDKQKESKESELVRLLKGMM